MCLEEGRTTDLGYVELYTFSVQDAVSPDSSRATKGYQTFSRIHLQAGYGATVGSRSVCIVFVYIFGFKGANVRDVCGKTCFQSDSNWIDNVNVLSRRLNGMLLFERCLPRFNE